METFSFRELEYDFVDVWGSLGSGIRVASPQYNPRKLLIDISMPDYRGSVRGWLTNCFSGGEQLFHGNFEKLRFWAI